MRNIGFWADMLIIFKLPHNFFHHKFKRALWASDSFVILKFTKVNPSMSGGVSIWMGDLKHIPLRKTEALDRKYY